MPAGRPRKPTNVLELTGRLRTNPDRRAARANEPIPEGEIATVAPEWMTKPQRKCYREIVRGCHKDVLCSADSIWVEMTACLLSEYRENPVLMKVSKLARLQTCLGQLGMSPADRAKAGRIPRRKENKFERFIA